MAHTPRARDTLPGLSWDGVVDASNAASLPGLALDLVEPGRRVVYIGLAVTPSTVTYAVDFAAGPSP